MSTSRARFQLALKQLKSSQWEEFERLCSVFLASEFSGLRTMASPGGDRGRDAELYSSQGISHVMFQYSVRSEWKQKINETIARIDQEFPNVSQLIFLSNQEIGAAADDVKSEAIGKGKFIDVRDRSWFLERMDLDDSRRAAAAELARLVVDPFLETSGIITNAPGIAGQQARTALLYLEMQNKDEGAEKGLTKLSFEALVRCALRGTSSASKKNREQVYQEVHSMLPQHSVSQLKPYIDSAIIRLSKKTIKHHQKEDEFHISYEEVEATKDRVAELSLLNDAFQADVEEMLARDNMVSVAKYEEITSLVRKCIELYFYRLGEEFAQAMTRDSVPPMHADMIENICSEISPLGNVYSGRRWMDFLGTLTKRLLNTPSESTTELLRLLSTSYTLFSFLSAVPDVQKATKKLFERGTIWLDTSVVLPVVAEQAAPEDMRPFTSLMTNLVRAGTKLNVTEGVLEEVERHINLCRTYVRSHDWRGRVPYVFSRYVETGRPLNGFPTWLETIVGDHRPIDDIADFFSDVAGIEVEATASLDALDQEVVRSVREYWKEVQERRRSEEGFSLTAYRLAEHDSENYLAALAQRRRSPGASVLGYSCWLLTLDSAAWFLFDKMDVEVRQSIKHPPLISLDFLLKYLAFGPRRDQIDTTAKGFSRIFTPSIYESIPVELINVAEQVRKDNSGLPERIIQRRIRDELDKQKMSAGVAQKAGLSGAAKAFTSSL